MNQARQNFLARAAFAQQQNRNVNVRDQRGLRTDLLHCGAGGHEEHVVAKLFHFSRIAFILRGADALGDDGVEFGFLEWLGQVVGRAQAHGLHHFARVADAGKHDDFEAGLDLAKLFQSLQSVDAGHEQIEQHQIRAASPFCICCDSFFAGSRCLDFVIVDFEQGADIAQHSRFVIDEQDVGSFTHWLIP